MKIIKYEKKGNNNYKVYLDDKRNITINEDVILKHKLLFKKEIDDTLLKEIIQDNNNYDIYNKCVKYIGVRLRSTYEIKEYMLRKNVENNLIDEVIKRLNKNKLLDDDKFTKAFIHDKLSFTTMGPYRIKDELINNHHINSGIIDKYINDIDDTIIDEKIDKQITKLLKSNKNKPNIKNKIYNNLLNLGYSSSHILNHLDKFNL